MGWIPGWLRRWDCLLVQEGKTSVAVALSRLSPSSESRLLEVETGWLAVTKVVVRLAGTFRKLQTISSWLQVRQEDVSLDKLRTSRKRNPSSPKQYCWDSALERLCVVSGKMERLCNPVNSPVKPAEPEMSVQPSAWLARSRQPFPLAQRTGWLIVVPLRQEDYDVTLTQVRDQLAIRDGHEPGRLPLLCDPCGVSFTLQHAQHSPKGGLIKRRHNDIQDHDAKLVDLARQGVVIGPVLVPADNCNSRPELQAK